LSGIELLIIENVGNLVCPAEFDVGEDKKAVVLSITEGGDKPLKYPLPFQQSAGAVLNKIDLLPYTDVDLDALRQDIFSLQREICLFETSCRSGEGLDSWCEWLQKLVREKRRRENPSS
jgi:hydrogenase nickel incorporation protein HypB